MEFPFVIRKLKKILRNEETLAMHYDRFAPQRIPEIKKAIEILSAPAAKAKAPAPAPPVQVVKLKRSRITLSEVVNQTSLFT